MWNYKPQLLIASTCFILFSLYFDYMSHLLFTHLLCIYFLKLSKVKDIGKRTITRFFKIWWDEARLHGVQPSEASVHLSFHRRWWTQRLPKQPCLYHLYIVCFGVFSSLISSSSGILEPSCDKLELPPWLELKLKRNWAQQQVILMSENMQRKFKRVKFTGTSCLTLLIIYLFFFFSLCSLKGDSMQSILALYPNELPYRTRELLISPSLVPTSTLSLLSQSTLWICFTPSPTALDWS